MRRLLIIVGFLAATSVPVAIGWVAGGNLEGKLGYSTYRQSGRDDEALSRTKSVSKAGSDSSSSTIVRRTFVVDQHGFPLTSDPVFDQCFRASYDQHQLAAPATEKVADSLTPKTKAVAQDCTSYHPNDEHRWLIPEQSVSFQYDPIKRRYTLPIGFYLKREIVTDKTATGVTL